MTARPIATDHALADLMAVEAAHSSGVYTKRPISLVRGAGSVLWDTAGNRYIDCIAGQGVANVGHNHPVVTAAIQEQLTQLMICNEAYFNEQRARFLQNLTARTPGDLNRVFLCNSGTEAVEGAIKAARFFTGRSEMVAHKRGYHGRTMGSLSLTWNPAYRERFQPLLDGVTHVPLNDLPAMKKAVTERTAAVVVEIIQGEGGVWLADRDYLHALRNLCDETGALLVFDEVQTGIGRTGSFLACEQMDVIPDILTLGKALAGGLPMGATIWRDSLGTLPPASHGSTFGGYPMACVAGSAVMRVLDDEDLPARAARLGQQILEDIKGLKSPIIREVRGRGLMIGIDLRQRVGPAIKALMDRGILASPAGTTVLRLLPPLNIPEDELALVVKGIGEVLHDLVRKSHV